jgi:glucosamine--fructose-6-phosphate aminotransferase (isomerizing)
MQSLGKFPDPFLAEIAGQSDAVRRAGSGLDPGILESVAGLATDRFPVFTGMGSSYNACYPAVAELARDGYLSLMIDAAELLHFRSNMLDAHTLVIAVSQSGESAETVSLARALADRDEGPPIVAVTNGADSPLATLADEVLDTRAGIETGPSTMTFAASLVALAAVARVLTGGTPDDVVTSVRRNAARAADSLERLVADATLPGRMLAAIGSRPHKVILARGPARAAAEMGALTIKEAAGIPVESLETAQFRHGPLELAGPELGALIVATEPETRDLDLAFAAELAEGGASVLTVTTAPEGVPGNESIAIGDLDRALAPAVSIVPVQLLARELAVASGREPGTYVRATKVTTRE